MSKESAFFGFTLVELLISVAIVSVLLSLGIAYYVRFDQSQRVSQVAQDLKSDLKLARGKALAGEIPASCLFPLEGYQITMAAETYVVQAFCGAAVLVKTVNLPDGITLTPQVDYSTVRFNVLGLGTNIDEADGEVTIQIAGYGVNQQVVVVHTGDVE